MKTPVLILPFVCSLAFGFNATAQERATITLGAADLAPAELRADTPTPGKWWLNRDAKDPGAPGGAVLMTGQVEEVEKEKKLHTVFPAANFVPYLVPTLRVDPHARGWYRIYVGLYNRTSKPYARLLAKLSDEPYPEYLQAPETAKEKIVEVQWKPADLTGRQLVIEQPPASWPHPGYGFLGGIAHVRLVPMSDADVKAAKKEIELPPARQRLFGMFDYTDEVFWWGKADTAEAMKAIVYRHQQTGFGRVYWRCFGCSLDNSLAVPEAAPRWTEEDDAKWRAAQDCKSGWLPYINMTKQFDPLKVASDYGREIGVEVHAWVRLTNFNRAPYAEFWHQNRDKYAMQVVKMAPESTPKKPVPLRPYQYSKNARVLSFAYPEVRAFYVKFFKQIASTGTPGIMIDLLRHPPLAGYEPISSAAFKAKYGTDMEELDLFKDPRCKDHLAGYLETFIVELRKEIGPKIEISVRSRGPEEFGLRGKKWIESGLINTIVDGNYYSGNGPRPTIEETIAAAGTRGHAQAVAESKDVDPQNKWKEREGALSTEAITALAKYYSDKGADSFGIYESTLFTWYPDVRRAIREAGWNYKAPERRTASNEGGSPAPSLPSGKQTAADAETIAKLDRFKGLVLQGAKSDDEIGPKLKALTQSIPDGQLPTVEQYAATKEADPIAWVLARLLIDRGRLDAAAETITNAFVRHPENSENRQYQMWKWWEYSFGEGADYKDLTRKIGEALVRQFAIGPDERKEVIASVFGKGATEARLPVDQFRKIIFPTQGPAFP